MCALGSTRQVLAAQLDWSDGHGVQLSLIDETGGRSMRCDFPVPVGDPDFLSDAVHLLLDRAALRDPDGGQSRTDSRPGVSGRPR